MRQNKGEIFHHHHIFRDYYWKSSISAIINRVFYTESSVRVISIEKIKDFGLDFRYLAAVDCRTLIYDSVWNLNVWATGCPMDIDQIVLQSLVCLSINPCTLYLNK